MTGTGTQGDRSSRGTLRQGLPLDGAPSVDGLGAPAPSDGDLDRHFMTIALRLARRGLGRVAPNPAVGCVLTRSDGGRVTVIGRGWTQPGGRPHGETQALARASDLAPELGSDLTRGATAYVTLEPCAHYGKTPPCADALIAAGIKRVVVALTDPDARVSGRGIERLRAAGITVDTGVLEAQARVVTGGFLFRVDKNRPWVTLKLATSLDGMIAAGNGTSQWITGPEARAHSHGQRATHDVILVGSGTALADNPSLTCRLPGMEGRSPIRVVLDTHLRLPLSHRLVSTARQVPTWLVTGPEAAGKDARPFLDQGVEILPVETGLTGSVDIGAALSSLADRGITRVLAEGGSGLARSLIQAGVVDEILWYRAPLILGGDGLPAIGALGLQAPSQGPRFESVDRRRLGQDSLDILRPLAAD